mgnify:CR=1 FL=1
MNKINFSKCIKAYERSDRSRNPFLRKNRHSLLELVHYNFFRKNILKMSRHSPSPIAKHTINSGRTVSPATQYKNNQPQPQIQITTVPNPAQPTNDTNGQLSQDQIVSLVKDIIKSDKERYQAAKTLMLWFSPATVTILLSDILNFYPLLITGKVNLASSFQAEMAYNSLILLQLIAEHEDTRLPFVRANLIIYLFPMIHHTIKRQDCDYLTGAILAVITSLVKCSHSPNDPTKKISNVSQQLRFQNKPASNSSASNKNQQQNSPQSQAQAEEFQEIIQSLVQADFLATCTCVLESAKGIIKISAAFILSKILSDPNGKKMAFESTDRIATILNVLNQILTDLGTEFDPQLSKNVVAAYRSLLPPQMNPNDSMAQLIGSLVSDDLRGMTIHMSCDAQYRDLVGQLRNYPKGMKR